MNNNMKCVMVMDEELPAGVAANTAALLGMTLGSRIEGAVGFDVVDQDGYTPVSYTHLLLSGIAQGRTAANTGRRIHRCVSIQDSPFHLFYPL